REFGPAVDAAGCKMPPAAMAGNFQIGVRLAGDLGHVAGNARQAAFLEREMRRAALRDPAMDHAAALAHRGGGVEIGDFAQALSAAHSRVSGNPVLAPSRIWVPAFAGTNGVSNELRSFPRKREFSAKARVPAFAGTNGVSNKLRSFPRKRESSSRLISNLGPRFRGDERSKQQTPLIPAQAGIQF